MFQDIKNYFANFSDATNACRTVALWVTLALLVAFVATKIFAAVANRKLDEQTATAVNRTLNGGWIIAALSIAVAIIITFTACYFVDVGKGEDTLTAILFYPLLVLVIVIVASAIVLFIKRTLITKIVTASVCGAALIAAVVCMIVYYASGEAGDAYSNIGLYISAILLAIGIVVFAFLIDRAKRPLDTRAITFGAVTVALSFALSYVRIFKMPMGGSITLASMFPIMLFAFMFGSRKGILVGLIYGILQAVQDPWILHPAQFALDYAVAFASVGMAGWARDLKLFGGNLRAQFALGAVVACALRFLSHYFAGVFAFGEYGASYAAEYGISLLENAYFYSFVYQCLYLIPELAIVIAVGMLALSSRNFRKQIELYAQN